MNINSVVLKSFIELSNIEKEMVLEWRNNNNIRKWMYTNDPILLDSHLSFIDKLQKDKYNRYFLVIKDEVYIGVIYFNEINYRDNFTYFGLYSNPNLYGVGSILMSLIIDYTFYHMNINRLIAEVFEDNNKAISLYKKSEFKIVDRKVVKDKKVLYLELIR